MEARDYLECSQSRIFHQDLGFPSSVTSGDYFRHMNPCDPSALLHCLLPPRGDLFFHTGFSYNKLFLHFCLAILSQSRSVRDRTKLPINSGIVETISSLNQGTSYLSGVERSRIPVAREDPSSPAQSTPQSWWRTETPSLSRRSQSLATTSYMWKSPGFAQAKTPSLGQVSLRYLSSPPGQSPPYRGSRTQTTRGRERFIVERE